MEHRFDVLAKSVSGAVSRREAIWRLGSGLALGVLALFGLGAGAGGPENCGRCCAAACANLNPPPRGHEMGLCIQGCLADGIAVGPEEVSEQCVTICA